MTCKLQLTCEKQSKLNFNHFGFLFILFFFIRATWSTFHSTNADNSNLVLRVSHLSAPWSFRGREEEIPCERIETTEHETIDNLEEPTAQPQLNRLTSRLFFRNSAVTQTSSRYATAGFKELLLRMCFRWKSSKTKCSQE